MVRSRQWTIYGVVCWQQRSRLCRERLRSGGERAWESRGELRSWQADSKTARWSWTMRMEMGWDDERSSGEKGWQSVPAPTIHCTALQLQAYGHALGARCFKLVGVLWVLGFWGDRLVLLGAACIFRGGRWRLQTCAYPETQELGSKKRKRGMGRKVHFCKSLGGGSRIPGLHLHLQLDRLVLPRATAHHPPRREGANPWAGNGISSCPIRGR